MTPPLCSPTLFPSPFVGAIKPVAFLYDARIISTERKPAVRRHLRRVPSVFIAMISKRSSCGY